MSQDKQTVQGVLELHSKGFGFLRNPARSYAAQPADPYVSAPLIQRLGLREGLLVSGPTEMAKKGAGPRLARVEQLEGQDPEKYRSSAIAEGCDDFLMKPIDFDRLDAVLDYYAPIEKIAA